MDVDVARQKHDLGRLNDFMLQTLDKDGSEIHQHLRFAFGGKRIRPTLVFLCARLCAPQIATETVLPLAAAMEMLHVASLIHDDIIDNSQLRRGNPSMYAQVGRHKAVLYGDYLLAEGLLLLKPYRDPRLYAMLAQVTKDMCIGELQQTDAAFSLAKQTMRQYFQRIRRKTAGLFSACCQAGAIAGQADSAGEQALRYYGENLGLAFQLCDDMLDFIDCANSGEPCGQDLQQGLFTLPLFFALKDSPEADRLAIYAQKHKKSQPELDFLLQEVIKCGGLDKTQQLVLAFARKAAAALAVFPDSDEKRLLLALNEDLQNRVLIPEN